MMIQAALLSDRGNFYNPNADIDCDGTIDSADYGLVSGLRAQAALRRGRISGAWVVPSGAKQQTEVNPFWEGLKKYAKPCP